MAVQSQMLTVFLTLPSHPVQNPCYASGCRTYEYNNEKFPSYVTAKLHEGDARSGISFLEIFNVFGLGIVSFGEDCGMM